MTVFQETLEHISLGGVQQSGRLTMVPLVSSVMHLADYALLDEAQREGVASVSEVSEHGSVPELLLDNRGTLSLFLLDGEELLGAKQNRIMNLSMLVSGETKQTIPVSCVEAGRWQHNSKDFSSTDRTFFASGRARKSRDVTSNMSVSESRRSDQGAVWEDVSDTLAAFRVSSDTQAVSDLYRERVSHLQTYVSEFSANDDHVGAVFVIEGKVCGIELFDAASTWQQLMPKVVRGYAVDAMRSSMSETSLEPSADADVTDSVRAFLRRVAAAQTESFDALGEGHDLRVTEEGLSGGALFAKGRVIHLCAFDVEGQEHRRGRSGLYEDDPPYSRTVEAGFIDDEEV